MDVNNLRVNDVGKEGKNVFKVGKERRVIKGPGTGLIQVPLTEREGVG